LYFTLAIGACAAQIQIPEATKVKVRLEQPLSSATAEENQPVQLAVSEDVMIDNAIAIPRESVVNGTIVQAVPKRRMGRTGKLDFSIDNIILKDGGKIPVRYSVVKKEGGSHAVRTGVITAGVAIVFWPAAPFMLLMKGKETTFNKGMTFEVFTDVAYPSKGSPGMLASQTSAPAAGALTNDDILKLKRAGFSDAVIISKIESSPGLYKVDTDAMIALKAGGISDEVVAAMVKKPAR
jgi:hypothetical protein